MDRALITGVSGQDGSYLAELLLGEGLEVFGLIRRKADASNWRIAAIIDHERFHIVRGDVLDLSTLARLLSSIRPKYVFNLAAQSFIPYSWDAPVATCGVTAMGVLNVLEAIRAVDASIRFYQASSSEMFGSVRETPQTENTPFYPRSPYGVSKVFGHGITVNYRESFDLYACSGILFNHESERRGLEFVTRKVTYAVARIKLGLQHELALGNLDAQRDWGYAPDYVKAMWLMLNQPQAADYVIASGTNHTVRDLCECAFAAAKLNWQDHVVVDTQHIRPAEVNTLLGDPAKAMRVLGWKAAVAFQEMIERMYLADLKRVEQGIIWET